MKITTKLKLLAATAVAGGVFTYFMDPVAGPARRRRLVSKVERRSDDLRDVAARLDQVKDAVRSDDTPDEVPTEPPAVAGVTDLEDVRAAT